MTKGKKKLKSRWAGGAPRYGKTDAGLLKKLRPVDGWVNGAKVSRR